LRLRAPGDRTPKAIGIILPVGIHPRVDDNSEVLVCARLFDGDADIKYDGVFKISSDLLHSESRLVEIRDCLKVMRGDTHIGNAENNALVSCSLRFISDSSLSQQTGFDQSRGRASTFGSKEFV
jgi:hypothetical protein